MSEVRIVALTQPEIEGVNSPEEFVAYAARVSNPGNQINKETAPKLLRYLAKHAHWSPFEMVHITMEIRTTRDIGRQILRHRSFSFQEFSQRYAEVTDQFEYREARMQDHKNRQNSIELDLNNDLHLSWNVMQASVAHEARKAYDWAIENGIAKEQARAVLPEGMTKSTMYMSGTLRSWIHYCELRMANGTQKEHMEIAQKAWGLILLRFPSLSAVLEKEQPKPVEKKSEYLTKDEAEKMISDFVQKRLDDERNTITLNAYGPSWTDPFSVYPYPHNHGMRGKIDKDAV